MARIAVVAVPFIRSADAHLFMEGTMQSLAGCRTRHTLDRIAIINDAGSDPRTRRWIETHFDHVEENDANILARAWNKGIRIGFARGADYCLVINLDLIFHPDYLDNLVAFAEREPEALIWSGREWEEEATLNRADLSGPAVSGGDFSAFLVDRRLFELVGCFDESFAPAYFEDEDMRRRVNLHGFQLRGTPAARLYHFGSVTLASALRAGAVDYLRTFECSLKSAERHYIRKWGGLPGQETCAQPFAWLSTRNVAWGDEALLSEEAPLQSSQMSAVLSEQGKRGEEAQIAS